VILVWSVWSVLISQDLIVWIELLTEWISSEGSVGALPVPTLPYLDIWCQIESEIGASLSQRLINRSDRSDSSAVKQIEVKREEQMRLKVTAAAGKTAVISVGDNDTLGQLVALLHEEGLLHDNQQHQQQQQQYTIKSGFPPKPIDLEDQSLPLLDLGIRAGDKLLVEQKLQQEVEPVPSQPSQPAPTVENNNNNNNNNNNTPTTPSTPHIKLADGYLKLVEIPQDNSCLFTSISTSVFQGLVDPAELRSVVADTIRENKDGLYNAVFLGRPIDEYLDWIVKPTSWGGAIELDLLSKYLGVTIDSIDVESGRVDSFNSEAENFIVVFYTGIHFDTISYVDDEGSPAITNFVKASDLGKEVLSNVDKLSKQLNHKGYVTNTSTFSTKCKICSKVFKGERDASQHASETRHYEFSEV
jgi:ubiquitin thioesterase OTU1